MPKPIAAIRDTTQTFTEIEEINHDLIMFGDGSCVAIIGVSAVNFGLLSETEQENLIYAYAGLLNSLSFPVQILIRSQHKDVSAYLELLKESEARQKNPKLAKSINDYRKFIADTVKAKEVLDKKFYIVLPFASLELGPTTKALLGGKRTGLPIPKESIWDKAQTVLNPKKDHILRLTERLGLHAYQLNNDQLMKLFFTIYNPGGQPPEFKPTEVTQGK